MYKIWYSIYIILKEITARIKTTYGSIYFKMHLNAKNASVPDRITVNGVPFLRFKKGARIEIGENVTFHNGEWFNSIGRQHKCVIVVRNNALLTIGDNTGISSSAIYCSKKIAIGKNVKIGGNVCIYDSDFHSLDHIHRREPINDKNNTNSSPVIIGDDVFVGAHTIILKGVSIGNRAIIGACSVVTKSIPEDEIWAGNPARCIRKSNQEPSQATINESTIIKC